MKNEDIDDHETYHQLEDTWTLWFQKLQQNGTVHAKTWLESLKEVMTFGTVEEFWRMFNNIKTPSEMPVGTDYCIFKEGVEPKWEAPEHKEGGVWTAAVPTSIDPEIFNKMWLYSLLACIGADFGHEEYESITGLYLTIRQKGHKIQLWCPSPDPEKVQLVGTRFQELLEELFKPVKLQFQSFEILNNNTSQPYTPKKRGGGNFHRGESRGELNRSTDSKIDNTATNTTASTATTKQ